MPGQNFRQPGMKFVLDRGRISGHCGLRSTCTKTGSCPPVDPPQNRCGHPRSPSVHCLYELILVNYLRLLTSKAGAGRTGYNHAVFGNRESHFSR